MGNPESAVHRQAYQLLLDARDLVMSGWSSAAPARDGEGRPVAPSHASARSWSLAGALEAAAARQDEGHDGEKGARSHAIASAALAAAIRGNPSEAEALRHLEGAIREAAAGDGRQLGSVETTTNDGRTAVRCLRCGTPYRKQATHEVLEAAQGCPSCGYQGWSFAEEAPRDPRHAG